MPTNDFLPFGTGPGANVMSQADYQALAARISGFQAGTAASAQLNKAWRQASIIACTLAQFIADQSGQNSVDDGTTSTLQANLLTAIRAAGRQATILADTGAANAYAAVNAPALSALPATGYGQRITIANANTGASTYAPDGLAARPIYGLGLKPLQGGELPVGVAVLMYLVQPGVNGGNGAWIIIESLGGASQVANATQSQHAVALGQLAAAIGTTAPQFDNSLKFATTAFVQGMGVQFSTILIPAVSTTLTAAGAAGALVVGNSSSAAINVALPALSTMVGKTTITFWNYATGNMTLNVSGTDTISAPPPLTFITLRQGDSVVLTSNGNGLWYLTGGSLHVAYSQAYGSNLGASGWKRTPDVNSPTGYMLEQWGSAGVAPAGSLVNVNFPIAFNAILVSHANPIGSTVNSNAGGGVGISRSTTGLTLYNWGSAIAFAMYWYVKGY